MQGWFFVGLAAGAGFAAAAAWLWQHRQIRRVRAAERRARAAERMAEIGAMTGGLAHEIKNPLSTIGLNAQLLHEAIQESGLERDEQSRLLSRTTALRRETERLGGILSDFLEFAGQVHLDRRRSDLNSVVQELADFFMPEAERQGVRMTIQPAPAPLMASMDVKRVKQALLNLMLNATQAMHGKARREAEAAGREFSVAPPGSVGQMIIRTDAAKDTDGRRVVRAHVIDTGPGIAPESLDNIFKPYFTTRPGGSGLGLPTSRRLIEEHGGRIEVRSEPGAGSEFVVVLPADEVPAA